MNRTSPLHTASESLLSEIIISFWQAFLIIACIVVPVLELIWVAFCWLRPSVEPVLHLFELS